MKTNGLTMGSYWTVTFLFNISLSAITFSVFYIFGREVLQLNYFTDTSAALMVVILAGWALSQVSIANFVQVFISKSKSATIVGYVMSIFLTLVGEALAVGVFAMPVSMPICTSNLTKIFASTLECRFAACSIAWPLHVRTRAATNRSMKSTKKWCPALLFYTAARYCFHFPSTCTR